MYEKKQIDALNEVASDELKNIIKQCDILLLAYILKTTTSEENAMSVADVCTQLNSLIPSITGEQYFPDRTMRRKFDLFSLLEETDEAILQKINKLLPFVLGGEITSRASDGIQFGTNTRGNGKQKRYYFEPVLSSGDMDLVWGSIKSNRFLSEEEKDYLLARLQILLPDYAEGKNNLVEKTYRHIFQVNNLPKRPKSNKLATLPVDSSSLLSHIQAIHEAIENEYQIEMIYGIYDTQDYSKGVGFHARNPEKPYILNPYAMIWNGGAYYLIATHDKYTNPVHFRVDRIISVKVHTAKSKDGTISEIKRSVIPSTLSKFFIRKAGKKPVFDGVKYANTYPEMKLYQEENRVDCVFECTNSSLQILIDTFGTDIVLSASPIKHSPDELDYNGKPQTFLAAKINGIQWDNAVRFAIAQSEYLTLIAPDELVTEVSGKIMSIANRYNILSH